MCLKCDLLSGISGGSTRPQPEEPEPEIRPEDGVIEHEDGTVSFRFTRRQAAALIVLVMRGSDRL